MIFGVLNPEKIWHQQLVHLPTLPVYYSHSTLRNPEKSFFNIIYTHFRLFTLSQKKQTASVVLQPICLLTVVYCFLLSASVKPNSERPTQLNSNGWRVFSSSEHFQLSWVELSRVVRAFRAPDSTHLKSTESASVVTQFSSGHVMSTCQNTNIIYLITEVMYGIYKSVWKMELQEGKTLSRLPWMWISMDICVVDIRLRTATEVWYQWYSNY